LSKQLGIKLKQGYYFSRPQLLKLPQDTSITEVAARYLSGLVNWITLS